VRDLSQAQKGNSYLTGHKLAHYEVLEPIGKGGMGEVYRAKDSKLGRDVAIKVLPVEFAQDEERLRRFQREAKVLASLNHPNIAAIYGVEKSGDTHYLVLELVPGETLAERISRGPIPVGEALEIAAKIAEALEEAHEQGIVHRDLKPANIKQTEDGKIKVLDYGLAKVFQEETADADSSMSPTLTRDATRVGVILGTAAYMSPEQAKGKKVDRRADVWAFGAVVYEMLTGKRAFVGEDVSETLAYVLTKEPNWDALPVEAPGALRQVLRLCLTKDAKRRVRDIGDVRLAMDGAFETTATPQGSVSLPGRWRPSMGMVAAAALAFGALVGVVGVVATSLYIRPGPTLPVERFANPFAQSQRPTAFGSSAFALSPDGSMLVYRRREDSGNELWVRRWDDPESFPVRGTNGGNEPAVSHDNTEIAFRVNGEIRVVAVDGGPVRPVTLGSEPHWGPDGYLYATTGGGIVRVPATGGVPELVTPDGYDLYTVLGDILPGEKGAIVATVYGEVKAMDRTRDESQLRRVRASGISGRGWNLDGCALRCRGHGASGAARARSRGRRWVFPLRHRQALLFQSRRETSGRDHRIRVDDSHGPGHRDRSGLDFRPRGGKSRLESVPGRKTPGV